jgi:CTP synthase (UTP-ammonia lyase)
MGDPIRIAIVGDFDPERLSHRVTNEALRHGASALSLKVNVEWLPTISFESRANVAELTNYHCVLCAPGGPYKSMDGALCAIRFAREQGWPFLGT